MARHPGGPTQWAHALLDELGVPRSRGATFALKQWARAEGGHWNNSAHFNPLNTTFDAPGATAMNSVGVKAYGSWDQGLKATVATLQMPPYQGIIKALHRGDYGEFKNALIGSPWGTKVLPDGNAPAPSPSRAHARGKSTRIPGVDKSAARQQLLLRYLQDRNSPDALLGLAQGLQGAQDIPGTELPQPPRNGNSREVVTAAGSVQKILKKAVTWDRAQVPYLWGGGHGSIARPGDQVDCSGFVSALVGLKVPQTSGQLMSWGKPGRGKWVTVYASDGHTFASVRDPKTHKLRWFGTSHSNPGGGAGEIPAPSASYLSGFAARHPG